MKWNGYECKILEVDGYMVLIEIGKGNCFENAWINKNSIYDVKNSDDISLLIDAFEPQKHSDEWFECEPINMSGPTTNQNDPINPNHYTSTKIEVIDYIEDKGFNYNLGNAVKYISRAGKKNPETYNEDLLKAVWYLNREINK